MKKTNKSVSVLLQLVCICLFYSFTAKCTEFSSTVQLTKQIPFIFDKPVEVTGIVLSDISCTAVACIPPTCPCNGCRGNLAIASDSSQFDSAIPIIGIHNGSPIGCLGDDCNIVCQPLQPGHWYHIWGKVRPIYNNFEIFSKYALVPDSFKLIEPSIVSSLPDKQIDITEGFTKIIGIFDSTGNRGSWYQITYGKGGKDKRSIDTLDRGYFIGSCISNKKEGNWVLFYTNNQKRLEGNFRNNNFDGDWKRWGKSGKPLWEGNYTNGKYCGYWQNWDSSGVLTEEINYSNSDTLMTTWYGNKNDLNLYELECSGKNFGKYIKVDSSGKKASESLYNLKECIYETEWYSNGNIKKKIIKTPVYKEMYWFENGNLWKEVSHKDSSNSTYVKESYYNGNLHSEGSVVQFKYENKWTTYFPDGKVRSELNFKNGKLDGICRFYQDKKDSTDLKIIRYSNGIPNEMWYEKKGSRDGLSITYSLNGALLKVSNFVNGKIISEKKIEKKNNSEWKTFAGINDIRAMLLRDSLIYVGTDAGLLIYDTSGNLKSRLTNIDGLPSNDISSLLFDSYDHLWVGTNDAGAGVLINNKWKYFTFNNGSIPSNNISDIKTAPDSTLYVACGDSGITYYKGGIWNRIKIDSLHISARSIYIDNKKNIWVSDGFTVVLQIKKINNKYTAHDYTHSCCTGSVLDGRNLLYDSSGLFSILVKDTLERFIDNSFQKVTNIEFSLKGGSLLLNYKINNYALGANGDSLFYFDLSLQPKIISTSFKYDNYTGFPVFAIKLNDNSYFVAQKGDIYKISKNICRKLPSSNGPRGSQFTCITEDKNSSIYIGSEYNGISVYDGKKWSFFDTSDGLPINGINCLYAHENGDIWVGTGWGAACIRNGRIMNFGSKYPLIRNICSDGQNRILLSGGSDPLLYYNDSFIKFTQLQKALDRLTSYRKEIYSIFTDRDKNIWVGSEGNIIRINQDNSEIFTIYNGVSDNLITGFAQAPDGHIWAGSWNGVSMFDGKHWQTMDIRDGMPQDWITAIAFDKNGELWCGTRSSGLLHYDGSLWEMFNTDDGVADRYITGLLIDSKNQKWITTNHGISLFTGKQKYPFKLPW